MPLLPAATERKVDMRGPEFDRIRLRYEDGQRVYIVNTL